MPIFQESRLSNTADGFANNKIKPNGIPDYDAPPPLPTFEFHAPAPEPIPDDNKEVENNFIQIKNAPEAPEELEIDKDEHAHKLVHCDVWECAQTRSLRCSGKWKCWFIAMFGLFMTMWLVQM